MTTDPRFKVIRSNSRLAGWLGYAAEDLKGVCFPTCLRLAEKSLQTHLFPLLRIQGFFDEVALELACRNGDVCPVLVNAYERRDLDGKPQFIRFTVYKATDRRLYEQNLLYAKTFAEASWQTSRQRRFSREQFIAVLGHDLRNPLGAIMGGR